MSEGLDRRIAALQADEAWLTARYWLVPNDDIAGQRAIEVELNVLMGDLSDLYRERDAEWGKNDDRILRDIANGYNGSEL